uniref:Uncharacterized protein n=2 Tax=Picea TaxID=3328 RepID=A0A117NI64_PICGL|nr:hypothetical protein ABT39_MTgene4009 [Picea glauca]QHR89704.1 hypothetical protein Q903MT_gene3726 [Picea sitchensis]
MPPSLSLFQAIIPAATSSVKQDIKAMPSLGLVRSIRKTYPNAHLTKKRGVLGGPKGSDPSGFKNSLRAFSQLAFLRTPLPPLPN